MEVTSLNNELVKATVKLQQKKHRDEEKKFLLEGFKTIEEAFNAGLEIEQVFVLKDKASKYSFVKDKLTLTTEAILKKISTTESAPEAVAIAKQKLFSIDDLKDAKKIVLLENIKDSGNLGTILRTAKALSQDAVILFGETVDLYNPKCVRSAVGNLWKIPVVPIKEFSILESQFKKFDKIATLPNSEDTINLKDFSPREPYLVMFGSEADGLSSDLIDLANQKVTIEMDSDVESLNLSVSVGIVLHKLSRLWKN